MVMMVLVSLLLSSICGYNNGNYGTSSSYGRDLQNPLLLPTSEPPLLFPYCHRQVPFTAQFCCLAQLHKGL